MLEGVRKKLEATDKIIKKRRDREVKMLWEIMKKADGQGKMNIATGKIMNKTPDEIKVIKRRMKRIVSRYAR